MVQVVNNLTDGGIDKALSAEMGKKIADFIGPMEDSQTPLTLTWAQGSIDINTGENIVAQVTLRSGFAVGGLNDKIRFVCNAGYFIKAVQELWFKLTRFHQLV